jgi:hypothetical protein
MPYVTPEQQARIYSLADQGVSARKIAEEPDMPNKTTVLKYLNRRREKEVEAQGVSTPTSRALQGVSGQVDTPEVDTSTRVDTEKEYYAFGAPRRLEESPVVQLSLHRSLVGMFLTPKELLDAKEARALPANAWLDAWGRVELRDPNAEPLWPAYGPPQPATTPSGKKYMKLTPEEARPAHRTAEGPKTDG